MALVKIGNVGLMNEFPDFKAKGFCMGLSLTFK
jgi:hypothetical protein